MGVVYKPYYLLPPLSPPVSFILLHILNPIHVCLGLQLETFYQHCHVLLDNVKWIFKIVIFVRAVMLGAIEIGFKTSIWCCILTHIFFWLNTENNADPYITKLSSLSSTRECDDDPEGTLFSWFGPILFLPHQRNVMDHSWVLAMNHICKNKKPCLYVHKKN